MARALLERQGPIYGERKSNNNHFIEVNPPHGTPMVVWVKCAYTPEHGLGCASMLTFPKNGGVDTDEKAIQFVQEVVDRTSSRGATHLLLLGADVAGEIPSAAYLGYYQQTCNEGSNW